MKVTRDQLEERHVIRFSSVQIALREGLIHLLNRYLSKAHKGQVLGYRGEHGHDPVHVELTIEHREDR